MDYGDLFRIRFWSNFTFLSFPIVTQAKGKELTALGNLKYSLTTAKSMRDADFAKAESDLQAKKEFDKKREVGFTTVHWGTPKTSPKRVQL